VAAAGIGIGKSGLAGMSLVHVLIFAFLFGARESTGVVLPMLLVGDVLPSASSPAHSMDLRPPDAASRVHRRHPSRHHHARLSGRWRRSSAPRFSC
jgi:hypothetical protein